MVLALKLTIIAVCLPNIGFVVDQPLFLQELELLCPLNGLPVSKTHTLKMKMNENECVSHAARYTTRSIYHETKFLTEDATDAWSVFFSSAVL